jgi:hypothetical protein
MTTNASGTEKRSAGSSTVRDRYIVLGEDAEGGTHLYRTVDETIFAFDAAGRPEHRFDIAAPAAVDDYMAHVADARGWETQRYQLSLADCLAEAL